MRLLLLHGPAVFKSREKLSDLKKGFDPNNIIVFENPTDGQVIESMSSIPLIFENRLYIFENPSEDLSLSVLPQTDDLTTVFWFDNQVDDKKKIIKFVKDNKGQIISFSAAKEITAFPFIDALGEKDKKAFVELQKLKDATYDTQYIITMVFYLLRSLSVDNKKSPPFVQKKIAKQRQNFTDLPSLYKFVLETDYKIKSGLLDTEQAEFNLVNAFVR